MDVLLFLSSILKIVNQIRHMTNKLSNIGSSDIGYKISNCILHIKYQRSYNILDT